MNFPQENSKNKTILSCQNNKIILLDGLNEKEKEIDLFKYLLELRHKDNNLKYEFFKYFDNIANEIPHLQEAVILAGNMILNKKTIGIIGDYDVDGTTATSMFVKYFQHVKKYMDFNYTYHIPNRFTEGYGPSLYSVNLLHNKNVNLIITVDSGTTSYKEIHLANELNIKSIILDHHLIQTEIPEATHFVNCQNSEKFQYLCGGGLAFVFIYELNKHMKNILKNYQDFDFKNIFDLVAISTICDFVPLIELNRTFVYYGMKLINYKYLNTISYLNPGIHMILEYAFYNFNKNTYISSVDVGFAIGPYINVAGRLEDANMIVEFLTNNNKEELEILFFKLQKLWQDRKKIQGDIIANIDISKTCKIEDKFVYVYNENIHEGIMGIIAAKLKDQHNKPSIVINILEEDCKGSIRSVKPFNAGEIIEIGLKENILIKGGGHEAAGGFSLKKNKLKEFYELIKDYTQHMSINNYKEYYIDHILQIDDLNKEFYENLQKIGPFGVNNKDFLFLFPYLVIKNIYTFSMKHMSFTFTNITNTKNIKGIWFFTPDIIKEKLKVNHIVNIVGNIKYINDKIEIYLVDIIF
jgi:single-stranded-DNA-specific exonuclease